MSLFLCGLLPTAQTRLVLSGSKISDFGDVPQLLQPMLLSSSAVLTTLSQISLIFLHPLRFQTIYWTLIYEDPLWIVKITEYLSSFIKIFFFAFRLDFKEMRRPVLSFKCWNWCIKTLILFSWNHTDRSKAKSASCESFGHVLFLWLLPRLWASAQCSC